MGPCEHPPDRSDGHPLLLEDPENSRLPNAKLLGHAQRAHPAKVEIDGL